MAYTSKKRKFSFNGGFLLNRNFWLFAWVLTAVAAFVLKFRQGEGGYNNYVIFKNVFFNFRAENSLYAPQPEIYNDLNHYGPFFALIIAPFALLPDWMGMFLWLMLGTLLFYFAIRALPIEPKWQAATYLISALMLYNALAMQQFNVYTAALLILSFVMVEQRREGWAALFIVLGTFVKIYGIVGLAFFFFVKRKPRFLLYILIWSVVAFLLPMAFTSPSYILEQYSEWLRQLEIKTIQNQLSYYQNISLLGMVRKISGTLQYSDMWIMLAGAFMFVIPYLRISQYKRINFRLMFLASALIMTVLFSSGSENSGYNIAVAGVGIWLGATPARRGFVTWALIALVMIASFAYNLVPVWIYKDYFFQYSLKALPFALVWLRICYELYFLDFYHRTNSYYLV